jgi:hypothetical protein
MSGEPGYIAAVTCARCGFPGHYSWTCPDRAAVAERAAVNVCDWVWHDGRQFHRCPLALPHPGFHARNDGTVPTAAEAGRDS